MPEESFHGDTVVDIGSLLVSELPAAFSQDGSCFFLPMTFTDGGSKTMLVLGAGIVSQGAARWWSWLCTSNGSMA